jgi:hypothetical protein
MVVWYRVFGSNSEMPPPAAILEHLAGLAVSVRGEFTADATGWYQVDLHIDDMSIQLERYVVGEEGVRAELNTWAAWLETRESFPEAVRLMERMIQTAQLFTLQTATESPVSEQLCRFLAAATAGIYQIDGRGIFAADGALLVSE